MRYCSDIVLLLLVFLRGKLCGIKPYIYCFFRLTFIAKRLWFLVFHYSFAFKKMVTFILMLNGRTIERLIVAFFNINIFWPSYRKIDLFYFVGKFSEDWLDFLVSGLLTLLSSSPDCLILLLCRCLFCVCRLNFKVVFICKCLVWINLLRNQWRFTRLDCFTFRWDGEILSLFFFRESTYSFDLFLKWRGSWTQMTLLIQCCF